MAGPVGVQELLLTLRNDSDGFQRSCVREYDTYTIVDYEDAVNWLQCVLNQGVSLTPDKLSATLGIIGDAAPADPLCVRISIPGKGSVVDVIVAAIAGVSGPAATGKHKRFPRLAYWCSLHICGYVTANMSCINCTGPQTSTGGPVASEDVSVGSRASTSAPAGEPLSSCRPIRVQDILLPVHL